MHCFCAQWNHLRGWEDKNSKFRKLRDTLAYIQGGADKLGQKLCLFLNSVTGVNKHLELCNFDCAFVYASRIRWHDVTTISSSNLPDSAHEACARAPDLQRRNDRRCSPDGPPQTNGVTIVVIIGLLLHHARTSLVAWAEARAARGPYPFRHELGCPPLPEIFPLPSCSIWFGVPHRCHILQVGVLPKPRHQDLLHDG